MRYINTRLLLLLLMEGQRHNNPLNPRCGLRGLFKVKGQSHRGRGILWRPPAQLSVCSIIVRCCDETKTHTSDIRRRDSLWTAAVYISSAFPPFPETYRLFGHLQHSWCAFAAYSDTDEAARHLMPPALKRGKLAVASTSARQITRSN